MPKATDPIIGTWKLNAAKSRFAVSLGPAPKQQTNIAKELAPDQIAVTETGAREDGSPISVKWTAPKQGGVLKFEQGALPLDSLIVTMINPGDWFFIGLQQGKQVLSARVIASKDGKTAIQTTRGTDPKGKAYEEIMVFNRQ